MWVLDAERLGHEQKQTRIKHVKNSSFFNGAAFAEIEQVFERHRILGSYRVSKGSRGLVVFKST